VSSRDQFSGEDTRQIRDALEARDGETSTEAALRLQAELVDLRKTKFEIASVRRELEAFRDRTRQELEDLAERGQKLVRSSDALIARLRADLGKANAKNQKLEEALERAKMFVCGQCSAVVPYDDGAMDDYPEWCSTCANAAVKALAQP
jgi:uncharacterized protein YgbK (DUF1537 family)